MESIAEINRAAGGNARRAVAVPVVLAALATLAMPTVTLAAEKPKGWPHRVAYVGAEMGYHFTDISLTFQSGGVTDGLGTAAVDGISNSLVLGYGFMTKRRVYLGAEVGVSLDPGVHNRKTLPVSATRFYEPLGAQTEGEDPVSVFAEGYRAPQASLRVSNDYSFTIATRIGYLLESNFMVYALIGWVRSEYDIEALIPGVVLRNNETLDAVNQTVDYDVSGFLYGAGIDYPIDNDFLFRVQYRYLDYGRGGSASFDAPARSIENATEAGRDVASLFDPAAPDGARLGGGGGSGEHSLRMGFSYRF